MRCCGWNIFLCYPSSTAQIMSTLSYKVWTCYQICHYRGQQDCSWYLKVDMSIKCDYSSQANHRVLYLICRSTSVYVMVLPLLLLFGLYKRHKIPSDTPHDDDEYIPLRKDEIVLKMTNSVHCSIWIRTTKQSFAFGIIRNCQKIPFTGGIEYFSGKSLSVVAIEAMIVNFFLVAHAHFKTINYQSSCCSFFPLWSFLSISCWDP